jgi:hypothetical protein
LNNRRNYFDLSFNNLNTNENTNTNTNINTNTDLFNNYYNYINNNNLNTRQNNDLNNFIANFLNSTVPIRPSSEQINRASRLVRYGDIENPLSESCPISLDEFNDDDFVRQLLPCGHLFHQLPFNEWFSENVRCPICRYDIRNYRTLSRRNTPNNTSNESSNNTTETTDSVATSSTTILTTPSINNTQNNNTNQRENNTISSRNNNLDSSLPISNINVIRDPLSNEIEHLTFDITDQQFTNNFLDRMTRNIFQTLLNPQSQNNNNNNDRFLIDPSNNLLFYETFISPNSNLNNNNNNNNNC